MSAKQLDDDNYPDTGTKTHLNNIAVYLNWSSGFDQWNLCKFSTPMDGSCLFHAISNSYFDPYRTEILNGKKISRSTMISTLRYELSQKLNSLFQHDTCYLQYH